MSEQLDSLLGKVAALKTNLGKIKTDVTSIKDKLASNTGGLTAEEVQALAAELDTAVATSAEVDGLVEDEDAGTITE